MHTGSGIGVCLFCLTGGKKLYENQNHIRFDL